MSRWSTEVRSVPDLLSRVSAGWRYEHCEPWEISQDTGWVQYWLTEPNGTRHPVRGAIAVAAWRRGLAKPVRAWGLEGGAQCS